MSHIRRIYCAGCASHWPKELDAEDREMGWQQRVISLKAKKPAEFYGEIGPMGGPLKRFEIQNMVCDFCNNIIKDGDDIIAITMWRDAELGNWEKEYSQ